MNRPTNNYLSRVHNYTDTLIDTLEALESNWGVELDKLGGNPSKGAIFFEKLVHQLASDFSKNDEIWSDIGWIASQLLKAKNGANYISIFNEQIVPLENDFRKNKPIILNRVYGK